jgi:hypothetical protein
MCPDTLIWGHCSGRLTSAQRFTIRAHYSVCAARCSCLCIRSASVRTDVQEVMTLLVKSKTVGKRAYIRRCKTRETKSIPLVKRIPMALEIDCRALTNRVSRGQVEAH